MVFVTYVTEDYSGVCDICDMYAHQVPLQPASYMCLVCKGARLSFLL